MKICFKCKQSKPLNKYYKHKQMKGGHLNKCIECTRIDNKPSSGLALCTCCVCSSVFKTTNTEFKNGACCCSRKCWYIRQKQIVKTGELHHAWAGDSVGVDGLHTWVKRELGQPSICEHCKSTKEKAYDWANKSWSYKRDVSDWIRLCRKCHIAYDKNKTSNAPKRKSSNQKPISEFP